MAVKEILGSELKVGTVMYCPRRLGYVFVVAKNTLLESDKDDYRGFAFMNHKHPFGNSGSGVRKTIAKSTTVQINDYKFGLMFCLKQDFKRPKVRTIEGYMRDEQQRASKSMNLLCIASVKKETPKNFNSMKLTDTVYREIREWLGFSTEVDVQAMYDDYIARTGEIDAVICSFDISYDILAKVPVQPEALKAEGMFLFKSGNVTCGFQDLPRTLLYNTSYTVDNTAQDVFIDGAYIWS